VIGTKPIRRSSAIIFICHHQKGKHRNAKEPGQQSRPLGRAQLEERQTTGEVWMSLENQGASIGTVFSHIPNFKGANQTAARLAELSIWKNAGVVKCNPDAPQIPVRLRALQDGKLLYAPVPELAKELPFIELDPEDLKKRGIPFESAAPIEGALKYGRKVQFQEMKPFDIAIVGCVAVTRIGSRTGKGGGFADLELGIFREMSLIDSSTPIVTTVHSLLVDD